MKKSYPDNAFGPNHHRVQTVIDLATADRFLRTPAPTSIPGVRSLPRPICSDQTLIEINPGLFLDWLDLLEWQRRSYISPAHPVVSDADRNAIENRLEDPIGEIELRLKARLRRWHREFQLDHLASALVTDVLHHVAFDDSPNAFWERVWQSLSAGGVPVGWQGTWPEGHLLAFWPDDEPG